MVSCTCRATAVCPARSPGQPHAQEAHRCQLHVSAAAPARRSLGSIVDRIAIMGCGGSGKSHLARELGSRLGITPVHLDARYYGQDWKPLD